jgi:hypothetical protein
MRTRVCSLLLFLVPTIGCVLSAAHNRDKQYKKFYVRLYINKTIDEFSDNTKAFAFPCRDSYKSDTSLTWLQKARCYMHELVTTEVTAAKKQDLRNLIIEDYVTMVNHAYGDFEHDSVYRRAIVDTSFDFANLGLTAATATVGLADTLGAAATGSLGAQHSIKNNFYNSQTAFVINNKMEALRLDRLAQIREREDLPVDCTAATTETTATTGATQAAGTPSKDKGSQRPCYTLEQGMNDVQDLFYAGTVHRALQAIDSQTATQSNNAKEKLGKLNTQPLENQQKP